jgi:VanZ family protein
MSKAKIKKILSVAVTAFIIAFIFSNSLMKGHQSSEISGGFTEFFFCILQNLGFSPDKYVLGTVVRKCGHFIEFSALGISLFSMFQSFNGKKLRNWEHVLFSGMSVALCDEIIQNFSEGRGPSVLDVALDFSGVAFGMLMGAFALYIVVKIISKKGKVKEIEKNRC